MKKIAAALAVSLALVAAFQYVVEVGVIDVVKAHAEPKSGPIFFVYFGADWCEPCRRMKANTLADPGVEAFMEKKFGRNVTIMDIDVWKKMAQVYKIEVVPTYLIIDETKELRRGIGYRSPTEFMQWLKEAK